MLSEVSKLVARDSLTSPANRYTNILSIIVSIIIIVIIATGAYSNIRYILFKTLHNAVWPNIQPDKVPEGCGLDPELNGTLPQGLREPGPDGPLLM